MVTKLVKVRIPITWEKTEVWEVPHGFGQEYQRRARNPISAAVWCDILGLVGFEVTPTMFKKLTLKQVVESEIYATREHLSASDNAIQRHPKPEWLSNEGLQHSDIASTSESGESRGNRSVRESGIRRLGGVASGLDGAGKGKKSGNTVPEKYVGGK